MNFYYVLDLISGSRVETMNEIAWFCSESSHSSREITSMPYDKCCAGNRTRLKRTIGESSNNNIIIHGIV
jgi:hypothetical protein